MAKSKTQFVVLQTNTNGDNAVFGPFKSHEEADGFKFMQAGKDHLHEFQVLEVLEPPVGTPDEEE